MKMHHYIYVVWMAVCLMAVSLAACSDHDSPGSADEGGEVNFRLALDVMLPHMPGSRASYEQGVGDYENTVNIVAKDYRVLLFTYDTNTLLANFDPNKIVLIENFPSVTNPTYRSYRLYAEVDKAITAYSDLKLVVLANWEDYPDLEIGKTTIDDLAGYSVAVNSVSDAQSTTFNSYSKLVASEGKHIPMFGLKDCRNITWRNFDLAWLGDLWLLRAVAKIEVRAAEDCPKLTEVKLTGYNALGTCAPKLVYKESDYVMEDDKYKSFKYLTLPGDKNAPSSPHTLLPDDNGVFTVYVPEYQILVDPDKPTGDKVADYARLKVKFDGIDHIFDVDFKYYTDEAAADNDASTGDFFDIKRNFYYKYTLNLTDPANLDMEVIVIPYIETILNPNFGLLPEDPDKTKGFAPVYSKFEDILYYTDGKDYLAPDKQTPITDPTKNLDATTGWQKIEGTVDGRNVLYFYYDPVNQIQYAPDRKTKIRTVFSFTEVGYLAYLELDDNDNLTGADNYHDAWHDLWYDLPPTKGYYVDKNKTGNGIGYVYDTNSNQVINSRTSKAVQFISVEKSIEVKDGNKYLLDTDGKRVTIKYNDKTEDVVLKIILLENPYPAPAP